MTKKTVEDLYKELDKKSINKFIKKEDLVKTLEDFMIRKEDINGLINNWEYKDEKEEINIDELIKHLKQREIIINDVIDINSELKFGNDIVGNIEFNNINENEESDNKSKSEYSDMNNKNIKEKEKEKYIEKETNNINLEKSKSKIINENRISNNIEKIENEREIELNIDNNNILKRENENEEIKDYDIKKENEDEKEENNIRDNEKENEENYDDEFNNQVEEEEKNENNISNEIEQSQNVEENEINNNVDQEEEDKKEKESPSTSKKKKKKSTSKKKKSKSKKSKEKLNVDDIINGELKVQVSNIENVMLPKTISVPCSFSLECSIEGIDKILKSREVIAEDLRNVTFNWATRILFKKRTLKDLSSFCNINLTVEQDNKNITL
jgi:hypothetical protein